MLTAAARPALVVCVLSASCAISERPGAPWLGTYFGGSAVDDCDAAATDGQGYVYLACHVTSRDLPGITRTELDPGDPMNAYVAKLTPRLDAIDWGVLLAGSGYDGAFAISVDQRGHAYVAGLTMSTDFPVTSNAFQKSYGGGEADAFFAEIDPDGELKHLSFLGGNGADRAFAIEIESNGSLLLGGATWSTDFPAAEREPAGGHADAFVSRLVLTSTPSLSTVVLGGRGYEKITGIAAGRRGSVFVSGFTESSDFPTRNALQSSLKGDADGFVAKLSAQNLEVDYATFIGGSSSDAIWGIDLLGDGRPVVAGATKSSDLPTTPNAPQRSHAGGEDAFIAILDSAWTRLDYCTYLGGSGDDSAAYDGPPIAIDDEDRVWVAGQTHSRDFPTFLAPQMEFSGGDGDGFVVMLDLVSGVQFASYVGGGGRDIAEGLALGPSRVWISGLTSSKNLPFPLTLQQTHGGGQFDSFLAGVPLPHRNAPQ